MECSTQDDFVEDELMYHGFPLGEGLENVGRIRAHEGRSTSEDIPTAVIEPPLFIYLPLAQCSKICIGRFLKCTGPCRTFFHFKGMMFRQQIMLIFGFSALPNRLKGV